MYQETLRSTQTRHNNGFHAEPRAARVLKSMSFAAAWGTWPLSIMKYIPHVLVIVAALVGTGGDGIQAAEPIDVGSDKQLILDGLFLAESRGVSLKIHPPRKTGAAILKREHEWESASLNWFNVVQDQGRIDRRAKYRMWYEAYDVDGWPTANDTSFCYAESRDGIRWTKPVLQMFTYKGSNRNNILFRQIGSKGLGNRSRVHGTGVFIDTHAPPKARYKAVGQGLFVRPGQRPHRIAGMYSADGLKWIRLPKPIIDVFADSQYSGFWDASRERYVVFGRVGGRGRSLGRSESVEFSHLDPLKLVAQTSDRDPPNSDLYNSAAIKYAYAPNVYLMFPSLYQHGPDTLDIRLAVSRDGIRWSRPDQKTAFIALGKRNEFDSGSLYMGQGMVRVGEQLWLYYSGSPLRHQEAELENLTKPKNARVYSRVVAQLDRFVAATAGPDGGSFTSPPLRFTGNKLHLNVRVRSGGRMRIGLLDAEGRPLPKFSVSECVPITGDSLSKSVEWTGGSDVGGRAMKPTRLRIEMSDTRLFGFQFTFGK